MGVRFNTLGLPVAVGSCGHLAQFYEDDSFLIEALSTFIGDGLASGYAAIVIATEPHLHALHQRLGDRGLDIAAARKRDQYLPLDAAEILASITVNGWPDRSRFSERVGGLVARVAAQYPNPRLFGELVALEWAAGRPEAALEIERFWNALATEQRFSLWCGYPMSGFGGEKHARHFSQICAEHTAVVPGESVAALADPEDRLRAIALLQQKANSLLDEVEARRQIQQTLSRREKELSDFLENALEGLHQVDASGTIQWANKAEMDLLGYAPQEYIGHHISEFHVDGDVVASMLQKLLCGEILYDQPARLRCKDGSIKHVLVHSNAFFEDGKFVHSRCFTRDVTDRVRLEAELQGRLSQLAEADRRKNEFLAMLGHELRNPLAPMMGALEILELAASNPSAQQKAREVIQRQARHLSRIIDDLLDISRISAGKIHLRTEITDLSPIIRRSLESVRERIETNQHRLSVALPDAPVLCNVDVTRLEQVLTNLFNNAAKYTNKGGTISVAASIGGGEVKVSIRDTGAGIRADLLPRIFELFTQGDDSLERSHGGLGVGLFLARTLLELHGGKIQAFSEGPGKGSEFVLILPLVKAPQAPRPPARVGAPARESARRVLVVDDNHDAVEMMALMLEQFGHQVRVAYDGISALRMAAADQPDIVLLDIGLPGADGYTVARQLRELDRSRQIRIVALTGYGSEETRRRCREAGFDHHVLKPIDPVLLNEVMTKPGNLTPNANGG